MILTTFRGRFDGGFDARISAAAADIALHVGIDVGIAGVLIFGEERSGAHDLARLAIATLGHIVLAPGFLEGMLAIVGKAFDRRDGFSAQARHGHRAGAYRLAIEVDGAGAALANSAAVFGANQFEIISENPENGSIRICLYIVGFTVNF